jgi:hypothetical protein
MAAQRPSSEPVEVTPTSPDSDDVTSPAAATDPPALVAPDSTLDSANDDESTEAPTPETDPLEGDLPADDLPADETPVVATEPVLAPAPAAPGQQVVYVQAPKPFVARGNRIFGVLMALVATVIYAALYAVAEMVTQLINKVPVDFGFLATLDFYAPVLMFAVGFIILVLIVNRAGWAAHVIGSLLVGLFVFFGSTGVVLLLHVNQIPSNEVGLAYSRVLLSIGSIIAALLGREVALWIGFAVAARGRRVKARNVEARALYDQEIAAKRAEYEQANARTAAVTPVMESSEADGAEPAEPAVLQ